MIVRKETLSEVKRLLGNARADYKNRRDSNRDIEMYVNEILTYVYARLVHRYPQNAQYNDDTLSNFIKDNVSSRKRSNASPVEQWLKMNYIERDLNVIKDESRFKRVLNDYAYLYGHNDDNAEDELLEELYEIIASSVASGLKVYG